MMISEKSRTIITYFNNILPDAKCALNYHKDYELLIAVMLSAQTTDKSVNKVTEILFNKYQTLEELVKASSADVENCIRSLGLYQNKAKNIIAIASSLIERFNGEVPSSFKDLTSLPGVGRKTANVVRCELFNQAEFPVDTHIERISKRLKFAKTNDNVLDVEKKLRRSFPKDSYIRLHHQFIHFGRLICKSISPKCEECQLHQYCMYYQKLKP